MSTTTAIDTAVAVEDMSIDGDEGPSWEVHSEADRYDGSRTPPERQMMIWQLGREGRSVGDIARFLGMKPYTVKAVLDREKTIIADSQMLLRASALEFTRHYIRGAGIAADKGKIEGIAAGLDRIGVTEPPKSGAQTSVGVQVILHGGQAPSELSLAKLPETSEAGENQAHIEQGLISQLMNTSNSLDVKDLPTASIPHDTSSESGRSAPVLKQDNTLIQASKCDVATGGDDL